MNQDNPFAESYRNESVQYKQEQMYIQQLKGELERLDSDINSLRTQIECLKHTAEVTKNEANDLIRETDRITSLVNLKRNDFKLKYSNSPLVGLINQTLSSTTPTTQSNSLLRSNTPKGKINT
jgi:archaellum component FlaC